MTITSSISRLAVVSALALGATHASADLADTWSLETEAHTFSEEEFTQEAFDADNFEVERVKSLQCAQISGGYNVLNISCDIIGTTGNGGYHNVNTQQPLTCNGKRFAYVPAYRGYVATKAIFIGACTGA